MSGTTPPSGTTTSLVEWSIGANNSMQITLEKFNKRHTEEQR